mgnify:CR=1 FL=1|jgi:sialic acid synthase SpsE
MKLYVKECRKPNLKKKETPTLVDKVTFYFLSALAKLSLKWTDMLFEMMESRG